MRSWPIKQLISSVMPRTRRGDIRPTLALDAPYEDTENAQAFDDYLAANEPALAA